MLRMYCGDKDRQWDEGIHFVLFAARESIQESLGFSSFKLVFGRVVCGPLKLIKEAWLGEDSNMNSLHHVSDLHEKQHTSTELAKEGCLGMSWDKKGLLRHRIIGILLMTRHCKDVLGCLGTK